MTEIRKSADHSADAGTLSLALGMALFAPIAFLGNEIGVLLRYPGIGSAVLFPPYAALTAVLVASPRRHWIWYILVGHLAHFTQWPQWTFTWVFFADVANIARALTAALLLRWQFDGRPKLEGVEALARFVVSTVLVAPAVGATFGAADVVLHDAASSFGAVWRAWFMSNALTGLTMMPAFVVGAARIADWRPRRMSRRRVAETIGLALAVATTCFLAIMVHSTTKWQLLLSLYAPLPVLLWAALRFSAIETSFALTAVTFAAIIGADRNIGPFLGWSPDESVLAVQLFVVLTSLTILCIVAVSSARRAIVHLHRAVLASARDRVAILDARGIVLEANDSWRRFAENDVASHHRTGQGDDYLRACAVAADRGDATASHILAGLSEVLGRTRNRFEIEYDEVLRDQRERVALRIETLTRPDGGAIVRHTDVTARHRAQIELEDQRRQLSHLARVASLGQLSGALAHELNQPLAAIGSNAEAARHLLKRRSGDVQDLDDILRDIITENYRAAEVIRRLRALLRRGETRLQPVDVAELIAEVLELAHAELITRRVTATSLVAPNLPPVLGDRVQLQQVLFNLILNACESMRATPLRERRLLIVVNAVANNTQISIRDFGTGIPPALIDRLFEPFFTTKAEGLGLGLSISRTIVAAHGGRLWAENNPDGGATLYCVLTSAPVEAVVPAARLASDGPPVSDLSTTTAGITLPPSTLGAPSA